VKHPRVRRPATAWLAGGLLVLTGCSGQGNAENHNAEAAALAFASSAKSSPKAACDLLAPQTRKELESTDGPCDSSLPQQAAAGDASVREVQVYGKDAIVHLGTSTLFLARFGLGWRVTAAGCTPQPDRPYDCTVRGS
jgi:hypothetical protein